MAAAPERHLAVPLDLAPGGGLRTCGPEQHLRDLVLQVLLTEPGERVNRPDFGCGVRRLVFAGGDEIQRATTRFLITQNLDRWLGDRLRVEQVDVRAEPGAEEALLVTVVYVVKQTGTRQSLAVATGGHGGSVTVAGGIGGTGGLVAAEAGP
ncbi:GPW/gp25 family protein [Kitasatospora sp. A2-31]|uniref:GPW/gp25 family protein n=1 Tax=Kitasatospora sp. A2-31 TaxID=2916414 RepID=UPI001EEA9A01|nr:GPW/gp25 family protein [Kitasatospora sp. A2-31]MCG6495448.1 GPW/gp25 family protein [Kitasatospora sp. A2-31]